MKKILFLLGLLVLLNACKDDAVNSGLSVVDDEDRITVGVDTFGMISALLPADYLYSAPDSFLLGECDNRFGTIHADILAQFTCPTGFEYPEGAELDSVCVYLYYTSWYGDGNSPMSLSIYEMDKNTFSYSGSYPSNLDVADYCTMDASSFVLDRKRVITAASPTDSVYSSSADRSVPFVRFRTSDAFAERFFAMRDYSSQTAFNEVFKGLYITSDFGSATLLHVGQITMSLFYHFTYEKAGRDTTVSDMRSFYANTEVRQVNRILYTNRQLEVLEAESDSVNYIVSPANIYTALSIPMQMMSDSIKVALEDRRPYVNQAKLMVDVLNVYTGSTADKTVDDWAQPAAYMLLLKESALDRFFREREALSDTCAILATLSSGTDADGETIYYYSYDLSTLLTQQLREQQEEETLRMVLVPVSVETSSSSSSSIVAIHPQQTVSATTIRSAQNVESPMRLEVVYSGF
ncbi:MAG: DUF4270 domain-containing protein [Paludibacter sp.]|nr:DUF4270 domain-containing protein [Bacteroidales bacterium]MCM1068430.1 DUF4270 domain-containing protein [Prevotella sp.]MCM1353385.1 DUF4270 domain-containing protein [Bacteroides sp.]MCM1442546.1 DUF4270 domain-containing protein [Muribaculum sp.]MCM1481391.1 DUF4270 domain-containing protein [Paludibacter sp.]